MLPVGNEADLAYMEAGIKAAILPAAMSDVETKEVSRRNWHVWGALIVALGVFALSSFVIYYKYMTTPETNCLILVGGNKNFDGAEVVVERLTTADEPLRLSGKLSNENEYALRFFLHSATYKIEVWNAQKVLLVTYPDEFVPPGTRLTLDLGRLRFATTRPGW